MIKESYSEPPYWEYDWRAVDWDNPSTNDVVALFELGQEVRGEHLKYSLDNKDRLDDIPSMSQVLWQQVIKHVHLTVETVFDPDIWEEYEKLDFAGSMVREDRMVALLDEEELEQYNDYREQLLSMIKEVYEDPEVHQIIVDAIKKVEKKKEEVNQLNELFYGDGK